MPRHRRGQSTLLSLQIRMLSHPETISHTNERSIISLTEQTHLKKLSHAARQFRTLTIEMSRFLSEKNITKDTWLCSSKPLGLSPKLPDKINKKGNSDWGDRTLGKGLGMQALEPEMNPRNQELEWSQLHPVLKLWETLSVLEWRMGCGPSFSHDPTVIQNLGNCVAVDLGVYPPGCSPCLQWRCLKTVVGCPPEKTNSLSLRQT